MEGVLARNVVGFLVQVVPCAVLCLIPFGSRFVCGARHAWARAAAIVAARLVLDDGTALPVSRRRYVEVRDALEAR